MLIRCFLFTQTYVYYNIFIPSCTRSKPVCPHFRWEEISYLLTYFECYCFFFLFYPYRFPSRVCIRTHMVRGTRCGYTVRKGMDIMSREILGRVYETGLIRIEKTDVCRRGEGEIV